MPGNKGASLRQLTGVSVSLSQATHLPSPPPNPTGLARVFWPTAGGFSPGKEVFVHLGGHDTLWIESEKKKKKQRHGGRNEK